MKKIFFVLSAMFTLSIASVSSATVDGHTRIYLVVQDIQSEEFFIERAPLIGCYGLAQGPQLVAFTMPYTVPSNVGCGMEPVQDQINYMTCAKITNSVESDDYMGFKQIDLDITGCAAKDDPSFQKLVKKAIKLNFPLAKGETTLNLKTK